MAVELCSEKSSAVGIGSNSTTPRISFSYDFLQSDVVPIEQRPLRPSVDFDFCVRQISFHDHEPSSADELFSDGKILPTELKKKTANAIPDEPRQRPSPAEPETPAPLSQAFPQTPGAREERETNVTATVNAAKSFKSGESKSSFWRFKRSSSCGSGGYGRTLCPLPLLSRSNSTGSADETKPINIKRTPLMKDKEGPIIGSSASKRGHVSNSQKLSHSSLKPPLKKSLGAYGNGLPINPVLNVPPANLLAVGSIFSTGKSKGKKK